MCRRVGFIFENEGRVQVIREDLNVCGFDLFLSCAIGLFPDSPHGLKLFPAVNTAIPPINLTIPRMNIPYNLSQLFIFGSMFDLISSSS